MPEEESKDETNANAHDPGHNHAHQQPEVGQGSEDCNELRHGLQLLGKHLSLVGHLFQLLLLVQGPLLWLL